MKYFFLSLIIGLFLIGSAVFAEASSNNLDSKMSSLNPVFEDNGIEIKYPSLLLFNEEGYLIKVVSNDKESHYISQDLSKDLLQKETHQSGLRIEDFPSEIQAVSDDNRSSVYLMVIDKSMCEACTEEKHKLDQWSPSSDISVNVNTVSVDFK